MERASGADARAPIEAQPRGRPSRDRRGPSVRNVVLLAVVLVAAACAPDLAQTGATLPAEIPVPAGATTDGTPLGVDGEFSLATFFSSLAPQEAAAGYGLQLAAAGFVQVDSTAPWAGYASGDLALEVQVSESGPPTAILVRFTNDLAGRAGEGADPGRTPPGAGKRPDPPHANGRGASPVAPGNSGSNGNGNGNGIGIGNGNGSGTGNGNGNGNGKTPEPTAAPAAPSGPGSPGPSGSNAQP